MDASANEDVTKPFALIGTFAALSVLYFLGTIIYNLYFHPLHHIPGPKVNSLSRIPYVRHLLKGTTADNVKDLHNTYGDVVRVSPNEVSFSSGETAWPDIYGFRIGKMKGHNTMLKDRVWYAPPANGVPSILIADDANHSRGRKTLSHAFSEKALNEQEALIQGYVDLLINRLKEVTSTSKAPVNMVEWYNWTTFDVIADLLFGEPFGCLQDLQTHKYIELLFHSVEGFRFGYILHYFPFFRYLGRLIIDPSAVAARKEYMQWVTSQTEKRISRETQRPDFMTEILKHNGEKDAALSNAEMASNAQLILTAGSETTATLLSGVTYLLLKNPAVLQKLKSEIRGKFTTYDEMTIEAVNNTPYLIAVLSEALRYFPPVPTGFNRIVPSGGEVVSGVYIPEKTSVYVSSYANAHTERNFKDPETFAPERWMGDAKYAGDKLASNQPFSFGPRACLGKNLAYAEMRLILAKMVWQFDWELDGGSENWLEESKVFLLWKKPVLGVRLVDVRN